MYSFADRVALITGAAGGIGRELARLLAADGARIAALDLSAEGLAALESELKGAGGRCATTTADVTDAAAVREAVGRLEAQLGPTDLLIAGAGVGRETSADGFRRRSLRRDGADQPDRRRQQYRRRPAGHARAAARPSGGAVQPGVVPRPAAHGRPTAPARPASTR